MEEKREPITSDHPAEDLTPENIKGVEPLYTTVTYKGKRCVGEVVDWKEKKRLVAVKLPQFNDVIVWFKAPKQRESASQKILKRLRAKK